MKGKGSISLGKIGTECSFLFDVQDPNKFALDFKVKNLDFLNALDELSVP